MRVDRQALAATLFGAVGLNPAGYAQGLNILANVKNPKFVLDPSSPKPFSARLVAAVSLRPVSGAERNRTSQQAISKTLMGGDDGEEAT